MAEYPNGQTIWNYLVDKLDNEYGAAGLMGNLYWESGLITYRVEGDFSAGYTISLEYTRKVDTGEIPESTFVSDAIGYGLAQWTYYTRKQGLYNMKETLGQSIGSISVGLEYLWWELNNLPEFSIVLTTLKNATSIREASDIVLTRFENPAVQTEAVKIQRAATGVDIYNKYSGTGGAIIPYPVATKRRLKSAERFLVLSTLFKRR